MKAQILRHGIWLLALLVLASTIAAKTSAPESTEPSSLRYSVDGLYLNMTESDVRERWGQLEKRTWKDGTFLLTKADWTPISGPQASFDPEGRLIAVTGYRLRLGDQLMLSTDHKFEEAEGLGEAFARKGSFCGNSGLMRGMSLAQKDVLFEILGFNPEHLELPQGVTLEKVLESNPEFSNVHLITLHDRHYYENSGNSVASARLQLAAGFVDVSRAAKRLIEDWSKPFSTP